MANRPQNYLMFSDWMKLLTVNGTWEEIWVMLRQESIKLYQQKNEDLKWLGTIKLKCVKYEGMTDTEPNTFKLFFSPDEAIWAEQSEISKWQLEPLLFLAPSELAYKCWINALSVVSEKFVETTNEEAETPAKEITMNTILVDKDSMENPKIVETVYVERVLQKQNTEETMDLGKMIWSLLSKFREGNNFSLPISLLEPRSSLDKFADSFLHIDILSEAAIEKDPLTRMKLVVKWYLSGFYLQSKSLKKPYIPKMGEAFRCFWYHPKTDSKTFFLAEQISDKPQEVAIHIINQKDGFRLNGSFIVNLSFSGNTVTLKVEDKNYHVTLLPFKEKYTLAMITKLWLPLTEAIFKNDQQAADYQFAEIVKKVLNPEKMPKYFNRDKDTQSWIYKYIDRPLGVIASPNHKSFKDGREEVTDKPCSGGPSTSQIVFFDIRGINHHEFVPVRTTVNAAFYLEVFKRLKS
ncbi:oxysterol-binding protein-related protein 8-like [Centruroides sculpturatus]|uniref:oxysterol-binding protein-related protein 8-like n=1 Tax=Centruroides sculpturatus TaxID=218467 RepID=UPI000C6D0747|nr:oxysterol-binding protein-related protein 8-like [Centruroides sculpturatus]